MNVCEFDNIAREVFAPIYPVIAEQIKQKTGITTGKCLDIGCGGGYLGIALASITELYIYLLDKSLEMLEIAASNISAAGLKTRMQTFFADVKKIPLPDQSINLIISRGSIFFGKTNKRPLKKYTGYLLRGVLLTLAAVLVRRSLKSRLLPEWKKIIRIGEQ